MSISSYPRCVRLDCPSDSAALFAAFADRDYAIWLDSGSGRARWDVLCLVPWITLVSHAHGTEITHWDGGLDSELVRQSVSTSIEPPLHVLRRSLAPLMCPTIDAKQALPFFGGAAGYWSYDLGRSLESLPTQARDEPSIPLMTLGIYDWAILVDHQESAVWLVGQGHTPATRDAWPTLVDYFNQWDTTPTSTASWGRTPSFAEWGRTPFQSRSKLRSNLTAEQYAGAFARLQDYIRDGDCYQVNLAQRFCAEVTGDPFAAYLKLRHDSPAPYGAYLKLPEFEILSNSPECFLRLEQGTVTTRPIKGTRPRHPDAEQDAQEARCLQESLKDRAENLMIVDLLRNDLGRCCTPGSIQVPQLFTLESYANVHHLVSTVTGQLAPGKDAIDLLAASFPGGSITGAPKLRAMQIIEELEPHRRGIYCGAIGTLGFDGNLNTNIAIRTALHKRGQIYFGSGGGITSDSECDQEYQETLDKASALRAMLTNS